MKIDFVSDIACPWCAIGMSALEQAIGRLGPEAQIKISFQPFELNPTLGPEGQDLAEHLREKYGVTPAQTASTRETIKQRGAELGFTFSSSPRSRVYNTFDAHRLLHWAGLQGDASQLELKRALFVANFTDGLDVSDSEVLISCAQKAGLDPQAARLILSSQQYTAEVRAAEKHWLEMGISSVPSIVIDERHLIQGGQPPEVFERALRQLMAAS